MTNLDSVFKSRDIIKKSADKKSWRMYGEKGTLSPCWWECKLIQLLWRFLKTVWRTVWRFFKKLGIKPPHNTTVSLLCIYHEETIIEKDICTTKFIAALFTIARTWKQPRCPLTDRWINKLWQIYTMEYYSTMKRNAFMSVLMKSMSIKCIIQSEVSQKEENKYRILTHIYGIQKDGTGEPICRASVEMEI